MSSNDIRDIMEMGASGEARPVKKQKMSAAKKADQYAGMSKEVRGLMMGDGVPPVQVQENRYKTKPKIAKRSQPWIRESFTNPARSDGLVLTHWVRGGNAARPETPGGTGAPVTPADSKTENDGEAAKPIAPAIQSNYYFAKFNTKPTGPDYTEDEYEQHLKSDDWSKEETDYLVELVLDFDLRWVVIWDRYDFTPKESQSEGEAMVTTVTPKQRSMEEMKYRYYQVTAKVMTLRHPLSSMSTQEFDLHEKMTKFDPALEATRKRLADALLARSPDELREEEVLLGELKRIVDNEDRFLEERKELYQRLDHPQSHGNIALYESSAGLISLMQNLLANDKNKKRRSLGGAESNNSPSQNGPNQTPTSAHPSHRGSISGTSGNKKGSSSQGIQTRQLSQRDEIRFGVTHHDRLTSGVSFRQGRIEKLVLAKSAAQQQKLHDALGQLGIPVRAVMPTIKVCSEYEKLIAAVHTLLDARKVSEKLNNETKVLKSMKESREKKERGEEDEGDAEKSKGNNDNSKMDVDGANVEENDENAKNSVDNEDEQNDDGQDDEEDNDEDVEGDQDEDDDNDDAEIEDGGEDEDEDAEGEDDADGDQDGELDVDADGNADGNAEADADVDEYADGEEEGDLEVEADADDQEQDDEQEEDDDQEENEEDEEEEEEEEEEEGNEVDDEPEEEDTATRIKAGSVRKRSASVLSATSDKSSKRTRK